MMVVVAVTVALAGMVMMIVAVVNSCIGLDSSTGTNGSGGINGDDNNKYNSCIWGDGSQQTQHFMVVLNVMTLRWLDRLKNDDIRHKYNF